MEIFKQIAPLKAYLKGLKRQGKSVGLVPTMGALHEGHLSLVKASQSHNQITVSTIFVNPTQFNNPADLLKYPRTLERDTELLKEVRCDVLFSPENEELYPEKSVVKLDFGHLDKVMEGEFRPGHFSGVGLVVSKLFHIIEPDHAYFGQKDWQQFAVISRLVDELKFNIRIHSVPTLREKDGLAFSSRNLRLNPQQRASAGVFYQALVQAKKEIKAGKRIADVKNFVREFVEKTPDVRHEYFEVAESSNLNLLDNVNGAKRPIMCIAGYVGEVRLIDNMFVDKDLWD
jgi:pantoate--beta-alanine ligase